MSNKSRPLSATVGLNGGGFYNGNRKSITLKSLFRIGYHFSMEIGGQRNEISLSDSDFSVNTYSLKIKYNHSINLLNSLYLQYNEAERKLITNVRINIIHAPLSDLFLVYSEMRDVDNTNSKSGYIALKVTKLFGI